MSFFCNRNNCCGGNFGHHGRERKEGVRCILDRISEGSRIRVHFDGRSRVGKFLGIQCDSILLVHCNVPTFIPIHKVTAIDLVGFK